MRAFLLVSLLLLSACSGGGGSDNDVTKAAAIQAPPYTGLVSGANTMLVKVSDITACGSGGYANEPCVAVTVCVPGTQNCQTVSNILLDTGSYGLRIFASQLSNLSLPVVNAANGNPVGECAQFGSGNAWGSISKADVILGGEAAATVPIQLIDSSFSTVPSGCTSPYNSPSDTGFNGILGVGLFAEDCGSACVNSAVTGIYYSCVSGTCTGTRLALSSQVGNPIAALPVDNNGISLSFQSVPDSGYGSITGQMVMGINTQTNNIPPSTAVVYNANSNGNFNTTFNGTNFTGSSFLDSGSNGIFFTPTSATTACGSASGFFCPASELNLSATIKSATGANQVAVSFNVGNAETLFNSSGNAVFSNLGGEWDGYFDWGIPFFYGRTVYIGIDGKSATINGTSVTGPYWAF